MGFYEEEFEEYVTPADIEFGYYANSFWGDDDSNTETEPGYSGLAPLTESFR